MALIRATDMPPMVMSPWECEVFIDLPLLLLPRSLGLFVAPPIAVFDFLVRDLTDFLLDLVVVL